MLRLVQLGLRPMLGKGSGRPSIQCRLREMGVEATPEQIDQLLATVKDKSLKKKSLVTEDEFRMLVNRVVGT